MLYLTFGQPIVVGFAISQKVLFNSSDIEKSWLSPFRLSPFMVVFIVSKYTTVTCSLIPTCTPYLTMTAEHRVLISYFTEIF